MKIDNSNKRVSNVIAGILLVFVACFFIALALGVIGNHLYIQDRVEVSSDLSLSGDIGNKDFVPVPKVFDAKAYYHTEPGYIENFADGMCDDTFAFPLFIDPNPADPADNIDIFLNNWWAMFEVYGGYMPCDTGSQYFNLYQKDKVSGQWVKIGGVDPDTGQYTVIGWSLDWYLLEMSEITVDGYFDPDNSGPHEPIYVGDLVFNTDCRTYWVAIIDTSCNNVAKVDSCTEPGGNPFDPCDHIDDKLLKLKLVTTWSGCGSPSQCFMEILVQILRIPNSRINM
ncbi:MAG: hypothetical protein ACFE92_10365 [Promethearchaeota archaeon]